MSEYPQPEQQPPLRLGDHYKTGSSKKRNELIHSGQWKEILFSKDGWYTLEKVRE